MIINERDEIFVVTYNRRGELPTNICMNNLKQIDASINLSIYDLDDHFTLDAIYTGINF